MATIGSLTVDITRATAPVGGQSVKLTNVTRPGVDGTAYSAGGREFAAGTYETVAWYTSAANMMTAKNDYAAAVATLGTWEDSFSSAYKVVVESVTITSEKKVVLAVGPGLTSSHQFELRATWTLRRYE
jgi:hypothetical protein